jgi:hypothetical protein
MGTDYKVNVCYSGHSIETEIKMNPPAVFLIGTRDVLLIILTEKLLEQIKNYDFG